MIKLTPLMLTALAAIAVPKMAAAQDAPAQPVAATRGCEFIINTAPEVRAQLEAEGLHFPAYDTLCLAVSNVDAGVAIDVTHGVANGHSFALAEVRFFDMVTRTPGWQTMESTQLSEDPTPGAAQDLVPLVIASAMQAISESPTPFLASINEERNRLYATALGPAPEPAAPADDCSITFSASPEYMNTINAWGDVAFGSEEMCRRLEAAGAGVRIFEEHGELFGRYFAWVRIGLIDNATQVNSPMRAAAMSLSDDLGEGVQLQMQRASLEIAIDGLTNNADRFFENLAAETAATREVVTEYPDLFRD